jgi:DegV family protein with EDD domain
MSKVAIVTDSTAYIPDDLVQQYNIQVAPQVLIWGSETYRDGVDILPDAFYQRLAKATVMPSTSQISIVSVEKIFRDLLEQGYDVLGLFISTKLSGTMDSATKACEVIQSDRIVIFDSMTSAMALGFQALAAARAAVDGANLAECVKVAERARERSGVILTVETLEFLHRGGRIGSASRFLGTALNIKPILEVVDGRLEALEKVRTRSKALNRLVELVAERTGGNKSLHLSAIHANSLADAQFVMDKASEVFNVVEKVISSVSPVIGTHVGPGTVGLCYLMED